jgi:DNA mismatch repair protein MutS2
LLSLEDTLRRLEFGKIVSRLAQLARSAPGREEALSLSPAADAETIQAAQAETDEGRNFLRLMPTADLYGWHDLRPLLLRAASGSILAPRELLAVQETVAAFRRIGAVLRDREGDFPVLSGLAAGLPVPSDLEREIARAVTPEGAVADDASPALAGLRRKTGTTVRAINRRLEDMVRSPQLRTYLQDPIITVRGDRYVLPVKVECRSSVPGLVHDQSASGATLYIEPIAVVDMNNELRRLQTAEQQEIERILARLSALVDGFGPILSRGVVSAGRLDFILTKARLSVQMDGVAPQLVPGPLLDMKKARHPLLAAPVPVDLQLGQDYHTLIITGPNTGGKTVSLKTAGLLVLLHQAGLHLPVAPGSRLGVFRRVFADIGDEQSIEESLSSFSSHLKNITAIMAGADEESLVLLDELGGGTDPVEGSALAQAILEELGCRRVRTVATTHYSQLKDFALESPGVAVAGMAFDRETFSPVYRLVTGRPGRSYALEMARKIGLDPALVERARDFLPAGHLVTGELLARLEADLEKARSAREEAEARLSLASRDAEAYQALLAEVKAKKKEVLDRAREEAQVLVREARRETRTIMEELRNGRKVQAARERGEALEKARRALAVVDRKTSILREDEDRPGNPVTDPVPGQEVFLARWGQRAVVLEVVDDSTVRVQVGAVKLNVPGRELESVGRPTRGGGSGPVRERPIMPVSPEVHLQLDMRGMRAADALMEMEKYLDDALLAGLPRVYLIHGKGTGALRAAVQQELREHPAVRRFRLGEAGEGGTGVTVVELGGEG